MEMSGFTQEQLDVREAVAKICSKYPDVRVQLLPLSWSLIGPGILDGA
jgi:hypothetical protein